MAVGVTIVRRPGEHHCRWEIDFSEPVCEVEFAALSLPVRKETSTDWPTIGVRAQNIALGICQLNWAEGDLLLYPLRLILDARLDNEITDSFEEYLLSVIWYVLGPLDVTRQVIPHAPEPEPGECTHCSCLLSKFARPAQ